MPSRNQGAPIGLRCPWCGIDAHAHWYAPEWLDLSHDPRIMRYMIEMIGADRIVLGTDYNQDAGYELPVDFVEEICGLTEEEKNLILAENASALFSLLPASVPA